MALSCVILIGLRLPVFLVLVVELDLGEAHARLEHSCLLEVPPFGQPREGDVASVIIGKQLVDKLVNSDRLPT